MDVFVEKLRSNWFIIAFLAGMVLWYGNVNSRLEFVEAKQVEQDNLTADITDLKIDVAVVKSTVLDIKSILKEN